MFCYVRYFLAAFLIIWCFLIEIKKKKGVVLQRRSQKLIADSLMGRPGYQAGQGQDRCGSKAIG